ncbi:MAG: radical SAM protein [Pirellulaceae bacterium]
MELPVRARGDQALPAGAMLDIRQRLRQLAARHDLTTVIACAFDHRTRILPFIYADLKMAPAGVRAIGSALVDSGFEKTRIVLQQWNQNFLPTHMRLDGRIPDMFLVSSMHLHTAECRKLLQDVSRIDPQHRPLVIAGGPLGVYEPWQAFSAEPGETWGADVAVTGEEYVLLELLEVLLSMRGDGEPMRDAFARARDDGALDAVPGLVYRHTNDAGETEELVDTGIQRLVTNLDELPSPVHGYRLLEPPSKSSKLAQHAIPANRVRYHSSVASMVMTFGCKFRCSYCPIPAYNQRLYRAKSGERVAEEFTSLRAEFGISTFFSTDDNFFNDEQRTLEIVETVARKIDGGARSLRKIRWATEATVHDTIKLQDHLPTIRKAGMVAVWLGVEDITASLVRKGQSEDKTLEAFRLLRQNGIFPVPMLMHHDEQPLLSLKGNYGLLNQLRLLRKSGALYMQALMLVPARGSKLYQETYTSGMAYESVDGVPVEPHISDGSYVIASRHPRPWLKQLNLLLAYAYFFNPLRFLLALVWSKSRIPLIDAETSPPEEIEQMSIWKRARRRIGRTVAGHFIDAAVQAFGMWGLFHTFRRTIGWFFHLLGGRIVRYSETPANRVPLRGVAGDRAAHQLPGSAELVVLQIPSACESDGETRKAA